MRHLLLTTCCILSFANAANAVISSDGKTSMPIILTTPEYKVPTPATVATPVSPAAITGKATTATTTLSNAATSDATTVANQTIKDIGGGFSVSSEGKIYSSGSSSPVAMLDSAGNVVSATSSKLNNVTQSALNGLMKGVTLPAGFGFSARTPGTFVQKNSYIAASDNSAVYYGTGVGADGLSLNSVVSTVVKAAATKTPTTATGNVTALPGSNQLVDATGAVIATYNPTTGQFVKPSGEVVATNSDNYEVYKAALAAANTPTPTTRLTTASNFQ